MNFLKQIFRGTAMFLFLLVGYLAGSTFPVTSLVFPPFEVRFKSDVKYPTEGFFGEATGIPSFIGLIQAGSTCKQLFGKGSASYLDCHVVVNEKVLEIVK